MLTTAYGWTVDYVVLIPVILSVAAGLLQPRLNWARLLAMALYLALEALTLAWIPRAIDPDRLDWQNLGRDPAITLIDPLAVLAFSA